MQRGHMDVKKRFCHFVNIEWKRLSIVSLVYLKNLPENVRSRRKCAGNITGDMRNFNERTIVT
jgi:hypothetical protein